MSDQSKIDKVMSLIALTENQESEEARTAALTACKLILKYDLKVVAKSAPQSREHRVRYDWPNSAAWNEWTDNFRRSVEEQYWREKEVLRRHAEQAQQRAEESKQLFNLDVSIGSELDRWGDLLDLSRNPNEPDSKYRARIRDSRWYFRCRCGFEGVIAPESRSREPQYIKCQVCGMAQIR